MSKTKGYSPIKRILNILFLALFFVSTLMSLAASCLNITVMSEEAFTRTLVTEDYLEKLEDEVEYQITSICDKYALPSEKIIDSISSQRIKSVTTVYTKSLYYVLIGESETIATVTYPRDDIETAVTQTCDELIDSTVDAPYMRNKITEEITAAVTNTLNMLTSKRILSIVQGIMTHIGEGSLLYTLSQFSYIYAAVSILSAVVVIFLTRKTLLGAMYALSAVGFSASAVCFAPILAAYAFNFPGKIALSASALGILVRGIVESVIGTMLTLTAIVFAAFAVLLVLTAVAYNLSRRKPESE